MIQSKKKFCVLFAVLVMCSLLVTSMLIFARADDEAKFSGGQIESSYIRGRILEVPDGAFALGDANYKAEHSVVFPDGRSSSADRVKLDVAGKYTLVYTIEEFKAEEKIDFTVVNSSASLFNTANGLADVINGVTHSKVDYEGVQITINESNTVINYISVVDLESLGSDTPFIDFMFIPSIDGNSEFSTVDIELTDLKNADNKVTIRSRMQSLRDRSYITASANGNVFLGVTSSAQGVIPWGLPVAHSFYGTPVNGKYYSIKYYYNQQTKQIHASPYSGNYGKALVLDLDEPNNYVDPDHVFDGFETNEVKISLKFSSLTAKNGNLIVGSVGGTSLGIGEYSDVVAPTIKVDFGNYTYNDNPDNGTVPYGVVNKPYKVFDAYAYDDSDGLLSGIEVEVYDANGNRQSLNSGSFTPTSAGDYTLVYTVSDYSGNMVQKRVIVRVKSSYDRALSFDSNELYNNTKKQLADIIRIPSGKVVGGSGATRYDVSVWLGSEKTELLGSVGKQYFKPEKAGTYKIRYEMYDYFEEVSYFEDSVVIEELSSPVINVQTFYPEYRTGVIYPLPIAEVLESQSGTLKRSYIMADVVSGAEKIGNTFSASQEGTVEFSFSYGGVSVTRNVHAVDISNKSGSLLTRYYSIQNIDIDAQNLGMEFSTSEHENGFAFINPILADLLSFKFVSVPSKSDFDSITFTVTDSIYSDKTVDLTFAETSGDYVELYINGEFTTRIFKEFDGVDLFDVSVKNGKIYIDGSAISKISYYKNGSTFEGFTSGEVLLGGKFDGVRGSSAIQLRAIGNHNMTNASRDRVGPMILISESYNGNTYKFVGDTLEIYAAQATDVLNGMTDVSVTVLKPDGTTVRFDNANEKRTITAEKYGDYKVEYTANDGSQDGNLSYTYIVRDIIPPAITILAENRTEVGIGETVTLSSAKAVDDTGAECTVYCYVISADGIRTVVENGGRYTFAKKGVYRVVYYANDAYYNLTEVSNFVEVK